MIHSMILLCVTWLLLTHALPHGNYYQYKLQRSQASNSSNSEESFFSQRVDHFDRNNIRQFNQRYFVNDNYWNRNNNRLHAVVFLCVGGEGPALDISVLENSVHCSDMVQLGKSVGALLVALEHRYYGVSIPTEDFSTENLKWLNTEQALADIASFHMFITEQYSLSATNKWVTWGGSYPGMLSALARYKYPHLIHAAISSSAPLQASVEMVEYNAIVAESIANTLVGGSKECLSVITDAHKAVADISQSFAGRRFLEEAFGLCSSERDFPLENIRNLELFAGDGVIALNVQENDPACTEPYCNIAKICTALLEEYSGTPIQRIAQFAQTQTQTQTQLPKKKQLIHKARRHLRQRQDNNNNQTSSCREVSYDNLIRQLANVSNPDRTWLYQTCSQWGFYQTCNVNSTCPFARGLHDLSVDLELCEVLFNISAEEVLAQVQATVNTYGGRDLQCSRTLFVNGEIDPWRGLSIVTSANELCPVINVKAASHHYWTHSPKDTDDHYIRQARGQIWKQTLLWLNE